MAYGPYAGPCELRARLAGIAGSSDPLFLAVIDSATGRAGGVVSYLRIEPAHGCIEIGHIWFGASLQRTPRATETIFLLADHAFDDLGNRRLDPDQRPRRDRVHTGRHHVVDGAHARIGAGQLGQGRGGSRRVRRRGPSWRAAGGPDVARR